MGDVTEHWHCKLPSFTNTDTNANTNANTNTLSKINTKYLEGCSRAMLLEGDSKDVGDVLDISGCRHLKSRAEEY